MLDGTRGLVTNTVYAFSNATAKMSGAARKVRASSSQVQGTCAPVVPCHRLQGPSCKKLANH